ncbi:rubredoxin [Pseudanabaena mucicola]|uniref:Rubredoxin n=1 Tax=Pseudanabaena mucicola FACHB-723 TaxID=2692860 RepID=A0ABR8A0C4_9CYAN|nr:rubredoxin [Pseudanabaena mucicola]MBD2189701.1 rubredoxin [Pseudanabaena mucicola FACHB-723]
MEPELPVTETTNAETSAETSTQNIAEPVTEISSAEVTTPTVEEELHRHECGVCGYIYEPSVGDAKRNIPAGTAFESIDNDWRCPVCNTKKKAFADIGIAAKPSGFTENLGYGFGVNVMTPGQKNLLIFGSLALAVAFFISLYALD